MQKQVDTSLKQRAHKALNNDPLTVTDGPDMSMKLCCEMILEIFEEAMIVAKEREMDRRVPLFASTESQKAAEYITRAKLMQPSMPDQAKNTLYEARAAHFARPQFSKRSYLNRTAVLAESSSFNIDQFDINSSAGVSEKYSLNNGQGATSKWRQGQPKKFNQWGPIPKRSDRVFVELSEAEFTYDDDTTE